MMMKTIEITISPTGESRVETQGFTGYPRPVGGIHGARLDGLPTLSHVFGA